MMRALGAMRRPAPVRRWIRDDVPFSPRQFPFFYGWVILVASTLGVVMSIPGQTVGVSAFTDHLIQATGLSRLHLSNTYLLGTVTSGLLLPWGGRMLDRYGARRVAMLASTLLAATLVYLAFSDRLGHGVTEALAIPGWFAMSAILVVGFTLLRFSGQGMLTMVSRTMLGKWFDRRRGFAAGTSGVFVSFTFAAAPLVLSTLVRTTDWRSAWLVLAGVVGLGMGLIAWAFYRDNPEECGLRMDGEPAPAPRSEGTSQPKRPATESESHDSTRGQALRTGGFWAVTLALSSHGLIITGITFHIVDLGAESGLSESRAVSIFLPMAVLSTSIGYVVGIASDRMRILALLVAMMGALAVALLSVAHLGVPWLYWSSVAGLGAAGGFFGPMSTVALPRFFGRTHLGAISGVQMMCMVVSSALGPTILAASRQWFDSYEPALYACCALPAAVIVLAMAAREPGRQSA
jgi:MFS family permease